jgi:putative membrane protein
VIVRLPPWHAHLTVWLNLGGLWAAYVFAVTRHHRRSPIEDPSWRRKASFFSAGMAVLWLGADWPLHDLAERYLYSMHMVQHLLFSMVAAPLIVAGMPPWMLRMLLRPRPVFVVFRFLTRPLVALILFNAVLLFTHWPAVVDASVRSEADHFALHVLLFASSFVMWWPVLSPLPELPPISPPAQLLYLFLQSLAPTIPASFLTFGESILYRPYARFPRIWGISAHTDQLIAGLTMKLVGGAILWAFIAAVFFKWHAREEREGWDALKWHGVEREMRTELAKR